MTEQEMRPQSGADLLERIRAERTALDATLARLGPDQWVQPVLPGGWSVKDVLAHITACEEFMVRNLREWALGEQVPPPDFADVEDTDASNERIYAKYRDMPLPEVQARAARSYAAVRALLSRVPDAPLFTPADDGRFLWRYVEGNTYGHYQEHREDVAAWLARSQSTTGAN